MTFLQVLPTEGKTQVNVKGNFLAVRDETYWSESQNVEVEVWKIS